MITELGKLYRPVTTRPEEDGRYLTIITTSSGDEATVQNFTDGCWGLPYKIKAWMPIPPVPDNFNEVCFLNVGNELELEEGETGSLVVHPPEGADGASIEVVVRVIEDLVVNGEETPCLDVYLKAYLGEANLAMGKPCFMPFRAAQKVLDAESKVKEKYGAANPELVLKVLEEQAELEEAQQKLIQDVFGVTDAD
jgi:hypothetical protein